MGDSRILVSDDLPGTSYSVVVEDDGRVAYAYLREKERIIADVWLYNRCNAPQEADWTDPSKAPFLNPISHAIDDSQGFIEERRDVDAVWHEDAAMSVTIRIRGVDWAVLIPGARPGWCRLARKAGPLARPLAELKSEPAPS